MIACTVLLFVDGYEAFFFAQTQHKSILPVIQGSEHSKSETQSSQSCAGSTLEFCSFCMDETLREP